MTLGPARKVMAAALCASLIFVFLNPLPARARVDGSVFDVTAFGAKGDGIADDTPAFKAALAAAVGAGGGVLYAPHSRAFYRLTGCPALQFNADVPITVRGDGRFLTVIKTSERVCNTIEVNQARFRMTGLTLDCVTQCSSGYMLDFRSGSWVRATDLWFGFHTFNDIAIGAPGLPRASSDKITLGDIDGHIAHSGGTGIQIQTGYSDIELDSVRLNCNEPDRQAADAYGVRASGSFDTLTMNYVYLQDCGYGMALTPADGAIIEDIMGNNVILDGMEHSALLMRPDGRRGTGKTLRVLLNNLWAGAQGAFGGAHAVGILLDGGPLGTGVDGVQISNFTIPLAQTYGIELDRGGNPTFSMHASFANGVVTGWSQSAPGIYPAVEVGLTTPVYDVDFSDVKIGAWGHVGTQVPAPAYRIFPGSKRIHIRGGTKP